MRFALTGLRAGSRSRRFREIRRQRHMRGFTLLETLIAMVVLALALSALMQSFSSGLRAVRIADDHLKARLLAQSLLAEHAGARGVVPEPAQGRWGTYRWTLSVAPASEEWAQPSQGARWALYDVAVTVAWPPDRHLRLQTLRLGAKP